MPKGTRVSGVATPITPSMTENPTASHVQVKEPRPFKVRGRRGVNRLDDPLNAPRAAGRKLCRSRKSDYLLPAVCQGVPCARRMIPLESRMREICMYGCASSEGGRVRRESDPPR